jgi:hypothetical protein
MTVMLAIPAHAPSPPSSSQQIADQLKAVFGDSAILCVQADDDGSLPAPAPHAHDNCPLCQFHAQALGLQAPDLVVLPGGCASTGAQPAIANSEALPPPSRWPSTAQPRGPPILV